MSLGCSQPMYILDVLIKRYERGSDDHGQEQQP